MRLPKVYHVPYVDSERDNKAYDCTNRNGSKILSYYTTLDSERQSEFDIDCKEGGTDFMIHQPLLKGSALFNRGVYQDNFVIIDDFSGHSSPSDDIASVDDSNLVTGLDLKVDRTWMVTATTANVQLRHYTYAICQRALTITANKVALDEV